MGDNQPLAENDALQQQLESEGNGAVDFQPKGPPENVSKHNVSDLVEHIGWGKYHWKVVTAMGMMSFADSAEIWIISLISKDLHCEWGITSFQLALIPGLVFFFMAVGSLTAGELSDTYGRQRVMLIVYYVFAISSTLSALAWGYYSFLILRCIAGFCIGANYGVSICYSAEMVPIAKRGFCLLLLDMFWVAGGVYVCFLAFLVMDLKHGWRYLILLTTVPCIIVIIILHLCDESVRFLVASEKKEEALKVINKMAIENGKAEVEGDIMVTDIHKGNILDVFRKPFTRTTLTVGCMFFAITWAFYGFFYLLPDVMSYGYCHLSEWFSTTYTNAEGCTVYTKAEYLFMLVANLLYIPGYIASPISAEYWGRKPTLRLSYFFSLVLTAALLICLSGYLVYVELFLIINFYGMAIATVWLYMPECYPTYIRSTATGTQNAISKFGAAGGSFITEYMDSINIIYSIMITSGVLLVGVITSIFLERETRGIPLRDTEEPEEMAMSTIQQTNYGASVEGAEESQDTQS